MDDRAAVCWLHRRAGFGLAPKDLEAAVSRGPLAEVDSMISAAAVAAAVADDPWNNADLPLDPRDRKEAVQAVDTWLDHMMSTTTPLVDRMAWLWHGHFVSALDKVKVARLMVDQLRMFRSAGLGSFADLLHGVTLDPAMLLYLDGSGSTGEHPNENFGREVLELFTIGLGGYSEADVKSGAGALSGWRVARRRGVAEFSAAHHDDTPRTYLGQAGVHDVDTVVAAITSHRALSGSISAMIAHELLGSSEADVVDALAKAFSDSGLDITALVRAALTAGLDGRSQPVVLAPVPWLVIAQRVTGAAIRPKVRLVGLRTAGQVPMAPPNVAGWPGGAAWFGSSTVVARANLAAAVADAAPHDNAARVAADGDDLTRLATALGLPDPSFGAASSAALAHAKAGVQRLALALCTPEFVLA